MKLLRSTLVVLVLALSCLTPAYAASGDRVVEFDDATVMLTQVPCDLGSGPDKNSEMKGGMVVFKDSAPSRKLCWLEDDGLIWTIDDQAMIGRFPAEHAKPVRPKGAVSI